MKEPADEVPPRGVGSADDRPTTLAGGAKKWHLQIPTRVVDYVQGVWLATVEPMKLIRPPLSTGRMGPSALALVSATILYVVVVLTLGSDPFAAYEVPELPGRLQAFLDVVPLGPIGIPLLLVVVAVWGTISIYIGLRLVRRPARISDLIDLAALTLAGPMTAASTIGILVAWALPGPTNLAIAGLVLVAVLLVWYLVRYLPALSALSSARPPRLIAALILSLGIGRGIEALSPSFLAVYQITNGSMAPTLQVEDHIVFNLTVFRWRPPNRDEIVLFEAPHQPGLRLIKRVVGLPGDTLQMQARVLLRNWTIVDEPYVADSVVADTHHPWMEWQLDHLIESVDPASYSPTRDTWGPLVVPPEHYLVLGDNRDDSLDSRYVGFVSRSQMVGPVFFRYWPVLRAGEFDSDLP